MRSRTCALRRPLAKEEGAAAATVGTIMLVVITVALVGVVGMFLFTIFTIPDEPPDVKVSFIKVSGRWSIGITDVSEEIDASEFRIMVKNGTSEFITYDSDGDAVPDELMVASMEDVTVSSADGPPIAPIVFVDADGDGKMGVGDSFVAYELYYMPAAPLLDADRGYRLVGPTPNPIPRNSTMRTVATPLTLGSSDINPGDDITVDIEHASVLVATRSGHASTSGVYLDTIEVLPGWSNGDYQAIFTVRPGEMDEWSYTYSFRVSPEDPVTPSEREAYDAANYLLEMGDMVTLVHKPSNSVVLEFPL
jgi:hypothetical protein